MYLKFISHRFIGLRLFNCLFYFLVSWVYPRIRDYYFINLCYHTYTCNATLLFRFYTYFCMQYFHPQQKVLKSITSLQTRTIDTGQLKLSSSFIIEENVERVLWYDICSAYNNLIFVWSVNLWLDIWRLNKTAATNRQISKGNND